MGRKSSLLLCFAFLLVFLWATCSTATDEPRFPLYKRQNGQPGNGSSTSLPGGGGSSSPPGGSSAPVGGSTTPTASSTPTSSQTPTTSNGPSSTSSSTSGQTSPTSSKAPKTTGIVSSRKSPSTRASPGQGSSDNSGPGHSTTSGPMKTSNNHHGSHTTTPSSSKAKPITKTSALVGTFTSKVVETSYHVQGGQTVVDRITHDTKFTSTTGFHTYTQTPQLSSGGGSSSSSGLSDTDKKIIGGVVGGVGGFLLLGGIAILVYRLRGRKSNEMQDEDYFAHTSSPQYGGADKRGSYRGASPFSTTGIESHHSTNVNTASNF